MLRTIIKSALSIVPSIIIFAAIFEVGLLVAGRTGFIPVSLPSYSYAQARPFWSDSSPDWGVWRVPGAEMWHYHSCFSVQYSANAHGMRDSQTSLQSDQPRVAVIGDSFVEGVGVPYGARVTELLEQRTGLEHLNFGTSGHFGSTQAMLLYERFVVDFDHDAVVWMILPNNDFEDDRPSEGRLRDGARWRPYLVGDYPNYEVAYPRGEFKPRDWGKVGVADVMREFYMTARAVAYYRQVIEARWAQEPSDARAPEVIESMYWDYDADGMARLKFAAERIRAAAGDRPLLIVTIPRPEDSERTARENAAPPLRSEIDAVARRIGAEYLDLLPSMAPEEWSRFFFTCDGHWSEAGHAFTTDRLLERALYAPGDSPIGRGGAASRAN